MLTREEECELAKEIAEHKGTPRGIIVRNKMVEANIRLVNKIARDYRNKGLSYDDLCQEGYIGLIDAAERFDYTLNVKFSTYASYWIKQYIRYAIINQGSMIRIPVHAMKKLYKWKKIARENVTATQDEIAILGDFTPEQIRYIQDAINVKGSRKVDLTDMIPANEKALLDYEVYRQILTFIDSLSPESAYIICSRFGLEGVEPKTLKEIGQSFGWSKEWIRKKEQKILQLIKERYA